MAKMNMEGVVYVPTGSVIVRRVWRLLGGQKVLVKTSILGDEVKRKDGLSCRYGKARTCFRDQGGAVHLVHLGPLGSPYYTYGRIGALEALSLTNNEKE